MRVRGGNSVTNAYLKKLQSMSGGGVVEIGEAAAKRQTKQADALNKTMPGKLMPELSLTQARQIKAANTPKATKRFTKETEGETEQTESDWIEELESPFETRKQTDRKVQPKAEANKRERARQAYADRKDKTDLGKLVEDAKERSKTDTRAPAINSRAADLQQQYGAVKQIARDAEMAKDYFMSGLKSGGRNLLQGAAALGSTFADAEAIRQANEAAQEAMRRGQYTADTYEQQRQANAGSIAENADNWIEELQAASAAEQQALAQQYADRGALFDKGVQTVAGGIGGMVPAIAAGLVNPALGLGVTALQGGGSGYTEALEDGATRDQARAMGVAGGALSASTEALLGGIPGVKKAGGLLDDAVNKAAGKLGGKTAQGIAKWGIEALGEGAEEMAESALNEAAAKAIYGKDTSIDELMQGETTLKEIAGRYGQDFAGGALVSGVLGGLGEIPELVSTARKMAGNGPQIGADTNLNEQNKLVNQQMEADTNQMAGQEAVENNRVQKPAIERRHISYSDDAQKNVIMEQTSSAAEAAGKTVAITQEDLSDLAEYYPDLRHMKAKERKPILQEKVNALVESLRTMLKTDVSGNGQKPIDFSINGNTIEVRLYNDGIQHVLKNVNQKKAAMLKKTAAIFENATYLYSTDNDPHSADSKKQDILVWDYFYTPITIDGQKTGVRIAVKSINRSEYPHVYDWKIKEAVSVDGAARPDVGGVRGVSLDTAPTESVPQAQENVNAAAFENAVPELDMEYNPPSPAPEASDAELTAEIDDENRLPAHAVGASSSSKVDFDRNRQTVQSQTNSLQWQAAAAGVNMADVDDIGNQTHDVISIAEQDANANAIIDAQGMELTMQDLVERDAAGDSWSDEDIAVAYQVRERLAQQAADQTLTTSERSEAAYRLKEMASVAAKQHSQYGRGLGYLGNKTKVNAASMMEAVQGALDKAIENKMMPQRGIGNDKTPVENKKFAKDIEAVESLVANAEVDAEQAVYDFSKEIYTVARELKISFRDLVKENFRKQQGKSNAIINSLIAKHATNEAEAQAMLQSAVEAFMDARAKAINQNMTQMFPEAFGKGKTAPKMKSALDRFMEVVNMGQYSDKAVQELVAAKYGVPGLDSEQVMQICSIANELAGMDVNSKAYSEKAGEIQDILADAMGPASFGETIASFPYVAMLSNILKTGTKNVLGNASMGLMTRINNSTVRPAVYALLGKKANAEHNAAFAALPMSKRAKEVQERRAAAYNWYLEHGYGMARSAQKFDATGAMNEANWTGSTKGIVEGAKSRRKLYDKKGSFAGKIIQRLADAENATFTAQDDYGALGTLEVFSLLGENSKLYQTVHNWVQDYAHSRGAKGKVGLGGIQNNFVDVFARAMEANGINSYTELEANPELARRIGAQAAQEAKVATFHDDNVVSQAAQSLSRNTGLLGRGVMPFAKTPANVAVRAVEYSPLGIGEVAYKAWKHDANGALDALSRTLTGSALMLLGMAAGSAGYLYAKRDEEDDKRSAYMQMAKGEQDYSLNVGKLLNDLGFDVDKNASVTLDALSPGILPMLVGARIGTSGGEGLIANALLAVADPMLDMTFLSGLSDLIADIQAVDDTNDALGAIAQSLLANTASQYIPSVVKQLGRSIEQDKRQSYYSAKDDKISRQRDQSFKSMTSWIPFVGDDITMDYVDQWGRTQDNGSFGERTAYNMLSPVYYAEGNPTPFDDQLEELYMDVKAVKNTDMKADNVYPDLAWYNGQAKVDGHRLTENEMQQYATVRGQTQYDLIEELMDSPLYDNLTTEQKYNAVTGIYSLANTAGYIDALENYAPSKEKQKQYDAYKEYGVDGYIEYLVGDAYIDAAAAEAGTSAQVKASAALNSGLDTDAAVIAYMESTAKDSKVRKIYDAYGSDAAYLLTLAHADGMTDAKKEEVVSYLDKQGYSRAQKRVLFGYLNSGKNPY